MVVALDGRLDSTFCGVVGESAVAVIEHQVVGPVVERKAHSRGEKEVLVTVVVEIAHGNAPGPQRLQSDLLGELFKGSLVGGPEKGIAEQHLAAAEGQGVGPPLLGLDQLVVLLLHRSEDRSELFLCRIGSQLQRSVAEIQPHPHVRMHVDDEDIQS